MPRQPAAGAARALVPAQDLRSVDECSGRICSGVRSDVSIVCVDIVTEFMLSPGVCNTVPVRGEVGTFTFGAERTVSVPFSNIDGNSPSMPNINQFAILSPWVRLNR